MGSFDGAEVCELVGLFLLDELAEIVGKENVGLYRDDGLAVIKNSSGPAIERIRKMITKLFQQHSLQITSQCNLKRTDFLDVCLDLENGTYCPYRKPNDVPLYINSNSNHPPIIKKQLPRTVARRISELSCSEEMFSKAAPEYNKALRFSGYEDNINYINRSTADAHNYKNKNKRRRNITWFNPPFSNNVATNIGKEFFLLLAKHFPPSNRLHKIINKQNVKLSYSCLPNMQGIIANHNKRVLNKATSEEKRALSCNCRYKANCPLDGRCHKKSIIYKASVNIPDGKAMTYYGCCEMDFKARYYNHIQSFKNPSKRNQTELSKLIWNLKDAGHSPAIKWSIACRATVYTCGMKQCHLCLSEKLAILLAKPDTLLNKRSELVAKCRHCNKFKLNKFVT